MFVKILNNNRSKLSWSLGGNIVYAITQWLIITVIARFGSAEDLGIYSLGLAITAPVVLFFSFQLRTILATDIKNQYDFPQYLGSRIIHLTFSFVLVIPISIFYSEDFKTILVIIIMGLVKYIEALSDICMGYFQKEGKVDLIGKSQLYRGISTSVTVIIIYIFSNNIIFSCLGLLIVMVLRYILFDLKKLRTITDVSPIFNNSWFELMLMTLPLGVSSLIGSLNTNIPRYFLDHFWGVEEVGIFSALYFILIAGNMLITPISLLAAPRIANAYNKGTVSQFVKINMKLSFIVTVLFILFFLVVITEGELLLTIFFGEKYAAYINSFIIISFSMLFGFIATFLALSIVAARVLKIHSIINFFVLLVTLIASYFCIKDYSIIGASYALLISRFFQMLFSLGLFLLIIINKKKKIIKE
jgi:O-antigen/teichoic acid export membrane protein